MKRRLIIIGRMAIILLIALFITQGNSSGRTARATAPAAEVVELKNLDQLKEAFQRDRGTVRLVSLLSPV